MNQRRSLDQVVTTKAAARILDLCPDMVRVLARQGKLVGVRLDNGHRLYLRSDVEALARRRAARRTEPQSP